MANSTSSQSGYSLGQIVIHWLTAVLVTFNYFYSEDMGDALHARLNGGSAAELEIYPQVHVWVGVAVLALVLVRLAMRAWQGVPAVHEAGLLGAPGALCSARCSAGPWGRFLVPAS